MRITAVSNYTQPNTNFKGKFAKTRALENYVSSLSSDDANLFLKNKKQMEKVDDKNVYTFTFEERWDNEVEGEKIFAKILKNGSDFLEKSFESMYNHIDSDEEQHDAANAFHNFMLKSLFNSLFDIYNPKRKQDEDSVKTFNKLKHKSILENCEPAVFNCGNVSELVILAGKEGYETIENPFDEKFVYDKNEKLVQKVEVYDIDDDLLVKDYDDCKLTREFLYNKKEDRIQSVAIVDDKGALVYRKIEENGDITEPY